MTTPGADSTNQRHALTLVEVVVSSLIVGVMLVAALNSLCFATKSGRLTGNRAVALSLADQLMTELRSADYHDPRLEVAVGEPTPILDSEGQSTSLKSQVIVDYVDPDNPPQKVASDRGAKSICVIINHQDRHPSDQASPLVRLIAIKTDRD